MRIRIISEIHEFFDYKDQWDAIFKNQNYSFFQSFEFNYYSWITELCNDKLNSLCIVLIENNEIASAIFPLYIDSKMRLRFINDRHADFCDVLSDKKFDFENILSEISNHMKFDSVHFINLKKDSFLYDLYVKNTLRNCRLKPFAMYSDLVIPNGSFPSNVIRYRSKQKTEFRRVKKKNIDKDYRLLLNDDADFPINEIHQLRERMIELGLRKANFLDEKRLLLLTQLFNSNRMLVSMVKNKNNIHAISFILTNENEYLFWIDMYDNTKMINIYNYILFMESISFDNNVKINFGRGVYDYKVENFKPDIKQLFAIYIYENQLQLSLFLFIDKIKDILKSIYKKGRPREVKHATCSADKARKLLNYKTKTDLKNGILKTYEYIKRRGALPFDYHINIEINNELTPETWTKKEL